MLLTAWSYAAGNGGLTDLLLLTGGVALLPGWLIWTARTIAAGRHRTAPGFRLERVIPTTSDVSILEAVPA